jgi:hypothetical protein
MGDVRTFLVLAHVRTIFFILARLFRFPINSQQVYSVDRSMWVSSTHIALLRIHGNSGYANAPPCYFVCTLRALFVRGREGGWALHLVWMMVPIPVGLVSSHPFCAVIADKYFLDHVEWGLVIWKCECDDFEFVSLVLVCFKALADFDFSRILTPLAISNEYPGVAPVGTTVIRLPWGTGGPSCV